MRTKSLSSPSPPIQSGKTSPCPNYSGKNSPCPKIDECEPTSPQRTKLLNLIQSLSPEVQTGPNRPPTFQPVTIVEGYLAPPQPIVDVPDVVASYPLQNGHPEDYSDANVIYVEVAKLDQFCQTDLDDENLTLVQWRLKYEGPFPEDSLSPIDTQPTEPPILDTIPSSIEPPESIIHVSPKHIEDIPIPVNPTTATLNQMETQFLAAELAAKTSRSPDHVPIVPLRPTVDTPVKKLVPKYSSVLNRSVSAATSSTTVHPPRTGSRPSSIATGVRSTAPSTGTRNTTGGSKVVAGSNAAPSSVGPRRIDMPKGVYPRHNSVRASMVTANQVKIYYNPFF